MPADRESKLAYLIGIVTAALFVAARLLFSAGADGELQFVLRIAAAAVAGFFVGGLIGWIIGACTSPDYRDAALH